MGCIDDICRVGSNPDFQLMSGMAKGGRSLNVYLIGGRPLLHVDNKL